MRQIIPFKKELLFKTKVSEITSISLEHTLYLKESNLISGEFHISGDYKMTSASINREKFYFTLPFEINLDDNYVGIGNVVLGYRDMILPSAMPRKSDFIIFD